MNEFVPWTDSVTADPIADLQAWKELIEKQSGTLTPGYIVVSSQTKYKIERFTMWLEESRRRLDTLPWWAVMRYLVLAKQTDFSRRGLLRRWLERRKLYHRYERWQWKRKYGDEY
jgi:hypothetical protein